MSRSAAPAAASTVTARAEPATTSRVERKREQRVGRILDATADVLGRQGITRFSLEEVADRLDVTKGSLYHYFPSRDELILAGMETLANRIMVELRDEVDGRQESATERLRRLLARQLAVVVWDYPASIELFTLREPAGMAARVKALRVSHDALFRALVEEGLASGEFQVTSASASLECIYAAINTAPLWIHRASRKRAQQQIDDLIETLLMVVGILPAA